MDTAPSRGGGHLAGPSVPQISITHPSFTSPFLLAPCPPWYLLFISLSKPLGTQDPSFPLHPRPFPEALQVTSDISVFIYRAYDFNFSIKRYEQGG